jgi:hypothetical protein
VGGALKYLQIDAVHAAAWKMLSLFPFRNNPALQKPPALLPAGKGEEETEVG